MFFARRCDRKFLLCHILSPVFLQLLFVIPTSAVCPQPDPNVRAEFFKSDAVFVGTVVSESAAMEEGDFLDGWYYRLRIQRVFRGKVSNLIEVFTENSSIRFPLELRRQYLLFAYKENGRLVIGNCGNSALSSQSRRKIREIQQIGRASDGEIEGRIVSDDTNAEVVGVRVVVRGEKKNYTTFTDPHGWFHIHVEPGKYSAHIESVYLVVSPFDLSYDNPNQFVVHKGGCALMQFVARLK